jgi:tRNA threonylcarbamoyladenosine biosynthesis protein TsaE
MLMSEKASPVEFSAFLADDDATVALGRQLASVCESGAVVFLEGELGAGKTTLARGVMRYFGHQGAVKSPTYTLVEPYLLDAISVYHFDLYRLADPEELEYLGMRDSFEPQNLCLIEWSSKGRGFLPSADLVVELRADKQGRTAVWRAMSERGEMIALRLNECFLRHQGLSD